MTKEEFINTLGNLAVAESNRRIANGSKYVLPSVCIGQSALETGYGSSDLMTKANAFFGIKAGGSWTGKSFSAETKEVYNGVEHNVVANFRAYDSLADSVADYYDLIINASRYSRALSTFPNDIKTPYDTLYEIWSAGYATDELYMEKTYPIISDNNLAQWDSKVDGKTFDPNYTWDGSSSGSGGSNHPIISFDYTVQDGNVIIFADPENITLKLVTNKFEKIKQL